MKKLSILLFLVVLLCTQALTAAQDAGGDAVNFNWFVDCRTEDDRAVTIWIGYTSATTLKNSYFSYLGPQPGIYLPGDHSFPSGTHHRQVEVLFLKQVEQKETLQIWLDPQQITLSVYIETKAPDCNAGTGRPDGGLSTVTKDVAPGCYHWEKMDENGNWGDTGATTCSQTEGDRTFTRLVLGPDNSVTDASRYRVFPA